MHILITLGLAVLANNAAAAPPAEKPSQPQAYCISEKAEFYPYTGENCKEGYQLGSHNCRRPDGATVLISWKECEAVSGNIELPFPPVATPPKEQPEVIPPN